MKSVLLSVKPQYVAKILNGEKTIEIRKKFPKDYVGWVYIYCTKEKKTNKWAERNILYSDVHNGKPTGHYQLWLEKDDLHTVLNGKVIGRFWCDKVEEIKSCQVPFTFDQTIRDFFTDTFNDMDDLLKASCLDYYSLEQYLKCSKIGYAIHITKVEPFDKPKEIKEFRRYCDKHFSWWTNKCLGCKAYTPDTDIEDYCNKNKLALTRAPESWCYVEI